MCRSTVGVDGMKREFLAGERLAVLRLCMVVVSVRFSSSTQMWLFFRVNDFYIVVVVYSSGVTRLRGRVGIQPRI